MELRVGEKVLVRVNLRTTTQVVPRVGLADEMVTYEGKVVTVARVWLRGSEEDRYQVCSLEEDGYQYTWSEDCFEPVSEEAKERLRRELAENEKQLAFANSIKHGSIVYHFSKLSPDYTATLTNLDTGETMGGIRGKSPIMKKLRRALW